MLTHPHYRLATCTLVNSTLSKGWDFLEVLPRGRGARRRCHDNNNDNGHANNDHNGDGMVTKGLPVRAALLNANC